MTLPSPFPDTLRLLEERLLDAEMRQSRSDLAELLAPVFREFGSSGAVHHRTDVLDNLRPGGSVRFTMREFTVQLLSEDVALTTYEVSAHHLETDRTSRSLRSSIWRRSGSRWQVVFHQGTRIPDPSVQS